MSQIKNLVMMQLKDTVDLSWTKSFKEWLHTIILTIVKFLLFLAFNTAILWLLLKFALLYYSDVPAVMTLLITVMIFMLVISDTIGLTKSLYFSEDNKVLITLPVKNNEIFISKLLVFFIYELKRSFEFIVPLILSCMINMYWQNYLSGWSFAWVILPLIVLITLPVLLGALFSIPALYLYRLSRRFPVIKILLILIGLTIYTLVFLSITAYLPEEISMTFDWPKIRAAIMHFINNFERYNYLGYAITRLMIGEKSNMFIFNISWITVGKFAVLVAICGVLFVLCYFISRPIFFNMMSKNFEYNRNNAHEKKNKKHSKLYAFNIKEARVSFRSYEIAMNYLLTYVTVPIVLLILDKLFMAMNKSEFGTYFAYAFNVIFIIFPLLMSNGLVATLYSKEGRAGYMKKTEPVHVAMPLISKLSFNLILVIPSIVTCSLIFAYFVSDCVIKKPGYYVPMSWYDITIMIFALLLLYYGHLFLCAKLDISNPQNEKYATSGVDVSNINQNRASGIGAGIAIVYFLLSIVLFQEETSVKGPITMVLVKLLILSIILFTYFVGNFVLSIKTIYERNKD